MGYRYSDPTANNAIGSVDREWRYMERLAKTIRESKNTDWAEAQKQKFTGIFARLLTDPDEDADA